MIMTAPTIASDSLAPAVAAGLDYLLTLAADAPDPETANRRLSALRASHPDLELRLLWETESFDDSVHYDLLLTKSGRGTVSLSFCPDRALPWPMRGVRSTRDSTLLRVNGVSLTFAQAAVYLDFVWDQAPLVDRLIDAALLRDELDRDPVDLPATAIQAALDAFRRAKQLYTPEATLAWLNERGITLAGLERLIRDTAAIAALRDRVVAGRIDAYLDTHLRTFDTAHLARLTFTHEAGATSSRSRIASGASDLFREAQARFLASAPTADTDAGCIFVTIQRRDLAPAVAEAVFAAAPGEILGPVPDPAGGVALLQVLSLAPAARDAATRDRAAGVLFADWLSARRRAATIDWNWGDAHHK